MKKTLIALAVAALPMAAAQADSSNVTIYGQMNASVDLIRTGTSTSGEDANLNRISSNASRLGFKGSEDLGNGMAANFQIEEQVFSDGSAAWGSTQRNTYVGLSGKSWGEVRIGQHDTPYKIATGNLDLFADTMGDYNSIIGNVQGSNVRDLRLGNVFAYISPNLSGLTVAVATSTMNESGNGSSTNPTAWSAAAMYANGPIFASLAWEKQTTAGTPDVDTKGTKFGFGYNFGDANVGFIYERLTNSLSASTGTRNAYGLNGSYKMGNNVLKAAYLKANDGDSTADTSAKNFTIGVDHNMSKRTTVYALYTKTTNASGGTYGIGGCTGCGTYVPGTGGGAGTTIGAAGDDPSAWSFGIKHSF